MPFLVLSLNIALNISQSLSGMFNTKTNRLHERCLRMIYNDKQSNSQTEELLVSDNSVSIHHRTIQSREIKMYVVATGMSPDIMIQIFQLRESHYHLRLISQFMAHPVHSVYSWSESASYLGPNISKLIALCISFFGRHGFWWKLLYDVRYGAHRNNITISLLIVHS